MKKIISILLAALFVVSVATLGVTAEDAAEKTWANPSGKVMRFTDVAFSGKGNMGYAANAGDKEYQKFGKEVEGIEGAKNTPGGITVAFDVMVSEILIDRGGMFSQIPVFMNNDQPYSYAAYNFTKYHTRGPREYPEHSAFECYSGAWPTYDNTLETSKYAVHAATPFDWQLGTWYRIAYQFLEENMVSVWINGEKMVEWEFDNNDHLYIIMFPQYCTAYFDNFVTANGSYDLVNENYTDNSDVYDYIDFENAKHTDEYSGVVAGDWSFTGGGDAANLNPSGYNLVNLTDIVVEESVVSIVGDANSDKKVTITDAMEIVKAVAGVEASVDDTVADLNGDGKVNVKDAMAIAQYIADWENKYDIGKENTALGKVIYVGQK